MRPDPDLFENERRALPLEPGAMLLGGFALPEVPQLLAHIGAIEVEAPFRHLETPGGRPMSVAMTNCGDIGWVSDRRGYRYTQHDLLSGRLWPRMPDLFLDLAQRAAKAGDFPAFRPDACLINRYVPGAGMSLHQDKDESDLAAPIVSISLGASATFLWGGQNRSDRARRITLHHGDVIIWGGPARMNYHGVAPLLDAPHPSTGRLRYNLTFRRAR